MIANTQIFDLKNCPSPSSLKAYSSETSHSPQVLKQVTKQEKENPFSAERLAGCVKCMRETFMGMGDRL